MLNLDAQTIAFYSLVFNGLLAVAAPFLVLWVRKLEKNTNSIKDELVATAVRMGHAEGKVEVLQKETTEIIKNGLPRKPAAAATVNMEVKEMHVDELNVPDKTKK